MKARILFHGAAILVLAATVAAAQSPSTPNKPANSAPATQSAERQASAPSVSEREASTGMASGKRQHSPISISAGRESSAPSVSEREASSGMASGKRQYSAPSVSEREASSGMASGKRQHEPVRIEAAAPEAAGTDAKGGNMQNASSNPMYKGNTSAGSNPLYEPKDKQAAPKPGTSHDTVEYKDGEDMTTRYRPGNNKTSNVKPTSGTGTTPPSR